MAWAQTDHFSSTGSSRFLSLMGSSILHSLLLVAALMLPQVFVDQNKVEKIEIEINSDLDTSAMLKQFTSAAEAPKSDLVSLEDKQNEAELPQQKNLEIPVTHQAEQKAKITSLPPKLVESKNVVESSENSVAEVDPAAELEQMFAEKSNVDSEKQNSNLAAKVAAMKAEQNAKLEKSLSDANTDLSEQQDDHLDNLAAQVLAEQKAEIEKEAALSAQKRKEQAEEQIENLKQQKLLEQKIAEQKLAEQREQEKKLAEENRKKEQAAAAKVAADLLKARKEAEAKAQALAEKEAQILAAQAAAKEKARQQAENKIAKSESVNSSDSTGSGHGAESGPANQSQVRELSELKQVPGNTKPSYDELDRLAQRQGTVVFYAYISNQGAASQIKLIQSSGHRNLDLKTLKAIKGWKFYPGQEGWVEIPFQWDLKGEPRTVGGTLRKVSRND